MRMSHSEFLAYEARRNRITTNSDGTDDESELHREIADECAARGWLPFHGSMAHRTRRIPGEPDFFILCSDGRLLMVECKSRCGKLSTAQLGIIAWAKKLGHEIHVVDSIEQFRRLCQST